MHNQEIGVVDVELYGLEEVLDCLLLSTVAVDEVFACATEHDLTGHRYLAILLEANWRLLLVAIVEDDSYAGFGNACLAAFVDEVLAVEVA